MSTRLGADPSLAARFQARALEGRNATGEPVPEREARATGASPGHNKSEFHLRQEGEVQDKNKNKIK